MAACEDGAVCLTGQFCDLTQPNALGLGICRPCTFGMTCRDDINSDGPSNRTVRQSVSSLLCPQNSFCEAPFEAPRICDVGLFCCSGHDQINLAIDSTNGLCLGGISVVQQFHVCENDGRFCDPGDAENPPLRPCDLNADGTQNFCPRECGSLPDGMPDSTGRLCRTAAQQVDCPAGQWCPMGSQAPESCVFGDLHCTDSGLSSPSVPFAVYGIVAGIVLVLLGAVYAFPALRRVIKGRQEKREEAKRLAERQEQLKITQQGAILGSIMAASADTDADTNGGLGKESKEDSVYDGTAEEFASVRTYAPEDVVRDRKLQAELSVHARYAVAQQALVHLGAIRRESVYVSTGTLPMTAQHYFNHGEDSLGHASPASSTTQSTMLGGGASIGTTGTAGQPPFSQAPETDSVDAVEVRAPATEIKFSNLSMWIDQEETKAETVQRYKQALTTCSPSLALKAPKVKGRQILHNVSGHIRAGEFVGIMGPSGSGKTTLMTAIIGDIANNTQLEGEVTATINGAATASIKNYMGFVPQKDIMNTDLTVRENVFFSAMKNSDRRLTREEIEDTVDWTLEILDLSHVAHSIIGDELKRGISGGQRKRVNVAMEMAAKPSILFLDEPTSGLDAGAAYELTLTLSRSARNFGVTMVAVLHQPRYQAFLAMDRVLLMAKGGHLAYFGETRKALQYFRHEGFHQLVADNPADFVLDVISGKVARHVPVEGSDGVDIIPSNTKVPKQNPSLDRVKKTKLAPQVSLNTAVNMGLVKKVRVSATDVANLWDPKKLKSIEAMTYADDPGNRSALIESLFHKRTNLDRRVTEPQAVLLLTQDMGMGMLPVAQVHEAFRKVDSDHQNAITYSQFLALITELDKSGTLQKALATQRHENVRHFRRTRAVHGHDHHHHHHHHLLGRRRSGAVHSPQQLRARQGPGLHANPLAGHREEYDTETETMTGTNTGIPQHEEDAIIAAGSPDDFARRPSKMRQFVTLLRELISTEYVKRSTVIGMLVLHLFLAAILGIRFVGEFFYPQTIVIVIVVAVLIHALMLTIPAIAVFIRHREAWYRDKESGVSPLAYYLSREVYFLVVYGLIFTLLWAPTFYYSNQPKMDFVDFLVILLLSGFALSGTIFAFIPVVSTDSAVFTFTLLTLVLAGFANGINPSAADLGRTWKPFEYILRASFGYWAANGMLVANFDGDNGILQEQVDRLFDRLGTPDDSLTVFLMGNLVIGIVTRLIAIPNFYRCGRR
eukprot:Clim_evm29s144 gene=Clim_evmTU29s144